jgi:hypothetical protein
MVERWVKTIEEQLRKVVSTHHRDWDKRLPIFLLSYRAPTHETTGMMHANKVFGKERLPSDMLFGTPADKKQSTTYCAAGLVERLQDTHHYAPEGGHRQHECPLRSPGKFCRIPGR